MAALAVVGGLATRVPPVWAADPVVEADVVIYGGTSAGIAGAVQARRMGLTVVVIEPGRRVGGLTSGGLGQTDIGNKDVIGGISREFYRAVHDHYKDEKSWTWQKREEYRGSGQSKTDESEDTMWTFEPSVALQIYQQWIERDQIPVVYGERLRREGEARTARRENGWRVAEPGRVSKGVVMDGTRIREIVMESGKVFRGKYFMDATYEGDLFAGAGVSFTVGREGNEIYEETYNGVQTLQAMKHQLMPGIDPYVEPGNPASGLLPMLDAEGPGAEGSSDHRVQAYCFRMCLTDHPENRIPFHKPDGYREIDYELLLRNFEAGEIGFPWINAPMPNRKTDTNNRTGFSTDFIGANYAYPEATYEDRKKMVAAHLQYQQGFMWTMANHPRVPEKIRSHFARFGMTKDEFTEGAGWQDQLYIREARRMIGAFVMSQKHCQGKELVEDSIGMAAYTMDSHNTQRYVDEKGHARNEGDVQVGGFPPYPISWKSLLPRQEECSNLAVPVSLSASHIAFGSIRMEPVFMILAQSAVTAIGYAIKEGGEAALHDINYAQLRKRLLNVGQILERPTSAGVRGHLIPLDGLKGKVVDDTQAKLEGAWKKSTVESGIHLGYHHDNNMNKGSLSAEFTAELPAAGRYRVDVAFTAHQNRATNVPVVIRHAEGETIILLNQRQLEGIAEGFKAVGTFAFNPKSEVIIRNDGTDGHVVIDAVRWAPVEN